MCERTIVTVGQILRDRMKKMGWDEYDLAYYSHSRITETTIKAILSGRERIDDYTAKSLEYATNISREFWLALDEHNYRQKGKEKFLRKSQKCGQAVFAFC